MGLFRRQREENHIHFGAYHAWAKWSIRSTEMAVVHGNLDLVSRVTDVQDVSCSALHFIC